MEELLLTIARALVDLPEAVEVRTVEGPHGRVLYEIKVDERDVGKIIGRQGRVINAIRTVAKARALRDGKKKITVELAE
ncbi:MAG: KH domain-containing protein [Firmicutes bacterium]|nr:KH domain-containing protein [Bacillota bacterium]